MAAVTDERLRADAAGAGDTSGLASRAADGSVRTETMALEEYVARVISGEGQPRAGRAAHEALAIVIRTFAARQPAPAPRRRLRPVRHHALPGDAAGHRRRPAQAALATAGRVLLDRGQPAFVYYSAHCAAASRRWPRRSGRGPWTIGPGAARDDACDDEPAWTDELTRAPGGAGAAGGGAVAAGGCAACRWSSAPPRSAPAACAPRASRRGSVSAHEFRMAVGRTLGWQLVRSTRST